MAKAFIGALVLVTGMSAVGCAGPSEEVVAEANSANGDFLLGPEDVLDITVWRSEDLTQKGLVVRPDGYISMPLIGEVEVNGRTAKELAAHITERLKEYKEKPSVHVKVKEVNSYYVYVLGDVAKPGKYQVKSHATVLQAIAMAGGFTLYAAKNNMHVRRTVVGPPGHVKEFKIPARYDELLSGDGEIKDFVLKTGDMVVVPGRAW
ncbi:MAG: polysaccharide biosynthesis/export family protein [Nitrospira sp.]